MNDLDSSVFGEMPPSESQSKSLGLLALPTKTSSRRGRSEVSSAGPRRLARGEVLRQAGRGGSQAMALKPSASRQARERYRNSSRLSSPGIPAAEEKIPGLVAVLARPHRREAMALKPSASRQPRERYRNSRRLLSHGSQAISISAAEGKIRNPRRLSSHQRAGWWRLARSGR